VEFCIHWLTITYKLKKKVESAEEANAATSSTRAKAVEALKDAWGGLLGASKEYTLCTSGGRGFDFIELGIHGHKIYSGHRSAADECISVELTGEYLERIGLRALLATLPAAAAKISAFDWYATRTDLAFDCDAFTPAQAKEAVLAGKFRSLVKRVVRVRNGVAKSSFEYNEDLFGKAESCNIGSRSSTRYLRIYRRVNGFGVYENSACTRVEMECKEERAAAVLRDLLRVGVNGLAEAAVGHLRDFIDFETPWWDVFAGMAKRAGLTLNATVSPGEAVARAWKWTGTQLAPTLSALVAGCGGDLGPLLEIIGPAEQRWSERHRRMVAEMQSMPLFT
jgi:DNA relaxase NicK